MEVAPFLPFQEHRPRTAAYVAMQEPNAKEPNAKEPNAKEPNAKELVALRPVVAPSSDSSTSAWCCVVLRGAAWCCVVLRGA